MTIQEFRDYMASGKPVIGGSDVHHMFHQLSQEVYSRKRDVPWSTWHPSTMDIRLPQFSTGCSNRVNRL